MRLAFVSREFPPSPRAGGIGTYTSKTARALSEAGHEVHVISEAGPGDPDVSRVGDLTVHRLPDPGARPRELRVLRRAAAVAAALRRLGPFDLVQACEWDGEAALYARRPAAPLITRLATPHHVVEAINREGAQPWRSALISAMERSQTVRSARVICPSRCLAEWVARDWGLDVDRIAIVPTGIEPPRVAEDAPPPAAELRGADYILYFGRLEGRKGVTVWVDALPAVLAANPTARAVFAGDEAAGAARPIAEVARERCGGDASRLLFLPHQPHPALFALIARARFVVLPSRWESMANACLEAIVLGKPVLSTIGSGFAEVIRDGVEGLLVPPADPQALAVAANRLLGDRALTDRLGRAARVRAAEYDLRRMAGRLMEVHQEVHSSTRAPAPERISV
jgi:glycosyltransferase involved in cell wall biosynthesis